jgi:hypothetical protein
MHDSDGTFNDRLLPGERLRWSGTPKQGLLFVPADLFIVPFSALWLAFAIYITQLAPGVRDSGFAFSAVGLIFIAAGLYMMVGRFIVDLWARRLTRYALTDKRALIQRSSPFPLFTAIDLKATDEIDLREGGDGRGSIRFGPEIVTYTRRGRRRSAMTPAFDPTPRFLEIENARQVFDMIQRDKVSER